MFAVLPLLTTRSQMSQWLVDIREVSYKMGGAAMRRYTKIQGASTESGTGLEGDGGGMRSQVQKQETQEQKSRTKTREGWCRLDDIFMVCV